MGCTYTGSGMIAVLFDDDELDRRRRFGGLVTMSSVETDVRQRVRLGDNGPFLAMKSR
jgi:hypothetical protein